MLEINNLEFSHAQEPDAAMCFDLDVADGEVLSLIGPSGSGKTTLLHLIAGFLEPTAGEILIDEETIAHQPAALRPVSIVFQQHNLFPHLDLYTNVALGVEPSLRLTQGQADMIGVALERLGLNDLRRRKPGELSGGQRQRVALARALVRRRKVLLLDEAFAALGPAQRGEMIELVKNLVCENQMVAILVSHQPRDALIASERTAFVDRGRVAALLPTDELLENPPLVEVRDYLGRI